MAHSTTAHSHGAHPLRRAAGYDLGIVAFTIAAAILSFATGQRVANWHNIVFPPIIMLLAAVTLWFVFAEIRHFWRTAGDTTHRGSALVEVVIALVAIIVVGPMLLIMPFIFFAGVT